MYTEAVATELFYQESPLLKEALIGLEQRQPKKTLATLDQLERRFPVGRLGDEVALARIDALPELARFPDVLSLLDGMALSSGLRRHELRVIRGELRLSAHRYDEAIADFSLELAGKNAIGERARQGMRECRTQKSTDEP